MKTYFSSDYCEGAHPSILAALERTNFEQSPGYGEDRHCANAREMIRGACGLPEADVHFLVGGTQTNATVISSILRPYQGVVCADSGHINVHETGAIEHGGHKVIALPSVDGKISASQVEQAFRSHADDECHEHMVQPGMVYISFPTELGTVYSRDELTAISATCRRLGLPLYIDGARLGYGLMSQGCGLTLKELAALADVFYIGGTKQGALFGEAVVITSEALKKDFRYFIKQGGGMLAKGRLLGIQFEELFRDNLYFRLSESADTLASRIHRAFGDAGFGFLVDSPTNQQFPILPDSVIAKLSEDFVFETWQKVSDGLTAVRFCTGWATTPEQVERLEKAVSSLK